MASGGNTGYTRILKSFVYSWRGLHSTFRHEEAFRQELLLAVVLVPLGLWLGHSAVEHALMVGSVLLVLVVELLNSAVEAAIDRFGGEYHKLSARAKDMASAAVFMAFINAVVIWALMLF